MKNVDTATDTSSMYKLLKAEEIQTVYIADYITTSTKMTSHDPDKAENWITLFHGLHSARY